MEHLDDKGLGGFDLFLSPHPDDIVYSAYSALADGVRPKVGVVFFNISRFTRRGLFPWLPVTAARTLEDKFILCWNRVRVSHLFLPDSSLAGRRPVHPPRWTPTRSPPERIFAPLGVGGHVDHLLVRRFALSWWTGYGRTPQLHLYEDLPYAARSGNLEREEEGITGMLSESCGPLRPRYGRLSPSLIKRKMLFSRLYLTQTDKSELFLKHAAAIGRLSESQYAERFYFAETF